MDSHFGGTLVYVQEPRKDKREITGDGEENERAVAGFAHGREHIGDCACNYKVEELSKALAWCEKIKL